MYKVEYESQLIRLIVLRRCDMNEQLWSIESKLLTLLYNFNVSCELDQARNVLLQNHVRCSLDRALSITFVALSIVLLAWKLECRT